MKKKILKIIILCSVAAVSVPFVSFAIPFSFTDWPWDLTISVLDEQHREIGIGEPYAQAGPDDFGDFYRERALQNRMKNAAIKAERRRAEEAAGRAKEAADRNIKQIPPQEIPDIIPFPVLMKADKDDVSVPVPRATMQLGLFNPRGYKHLSDYLNQFTDRESGRLTTRGFFDGDLKKNLITETMNIFNDRARKQHDQLLPEGFIKFLTSKDGSFWLNKASNDHSIFDSRLASSVLYTNPRFKDFIRFQPEPPYAGRDTGPLPSVGGPGIRGRGPQPPAHIDTGGGLVSDVPDTGFTFLFPAELLFPQLKQLSWNSPHPSLIYGNTESSSIGFIMNFAPGGEKPKHLYTVIFSELPNKNKKPNTSGFPRDILFYVAQVPRVDRGRFVQDVVMHPVSLTQFLKTLQNDGIVELSSIQFQEYFRFGKKRIREIKIPYRAGSGNKISHVEWLD